MPLTRFRTWYTQMNFAYPDTGAAANTSKSFLYGYYRLLTSAAAGTNGPEGAPPAGSLWTVEGSSNGTVGAMDAVDRWGGGTFSLANFVNATNGNAHSWIVLKSPNALGPLYLCIDYNSANSANAQWVLASTPFTGGSVTTRPTSTTQSTWQFDGAGQVALPAQVQPGKIHMCRNDDGGIYVAASIDGSGFFIRLHMLQKLTATRAGDLAPWFQYWTSNEVSPGIGNNAGFYQGSYGLYGRNFLNTAQLIGQSTGYLTGGTVSPNDITLNAVNTDGTLDAVPAYFGWFGQSQVGLRGRIEDLYSMYQKVSPGTMIPAAGPYLFTALQNMVIPFSVSPSL